MSEKITKKMVLEMEIFIFEQNHNQKKFSVVGESILRLSLITQTLHVTSPFLKICVSIVFLATALFFDSRSCRLFMDRKMYLKIYYSKFVLLSLCVCSYLLESLVRKSWSVTQPIKVRQRGIPTHYKRN